MKLVLALFLFFTVHTAHSEVQCGNTKFCRIGLKPFQSGNPSEFKSERQNALKLKFLVEHNIVGVRNDSKYHDLIEYQNKICDDDTIGFLLDVNPIDYQISCVWTGATQFGQCRLVPPKFATKTFYYISVHEWVRKLNKVKKELGCSQPFQNPGRNTTGKNVTRRVLQDSELYICNDRCVQGGIGYTASILIILTLALSFFKNCVDGA